MDAKAWLRSVFAYDKILGRVTRLPLVLVPDNRVVRVKSGINKSARWITGSGTTHGCWIGNYEADHAAGILRLVKPGAVVYDIGSHAGYYTLALSRLVGDTGRVYAFEPSARSVTVVQVAIGDRSSMVNFDGFRLTAGEGYLVPSMSLDDFISYGNPCPSFVKMDIEGAEESALNGAVGLLSTGNATWMIATHSDELRIKCRELMAIYGYHFEGFESVDDPGGVQEFLAIPR
jgi:hypothetical protein